MVNALEIKASGLPTRRVWIPKPGKDEKRPLGIPVMRDRGTQALLKLALEPEWEALFEPHSYGFRPARSTHDAVEAIHTAVHLHCHDQIHGDIGNLSTQLSTYDNGQFGEEPDEGQTFTSGSEAEHEG